MDAETIAAGPWIEGPPPEVEGLRVLVEDKWGRYAAGACFHQLAENLDTEDQWLVGWCRFSKIVRHAVINLPPPRGKE